jgi:hypothetical protein
MLSVGHSFGVDAERGSDSGELSTSSLSAQSATQTNHQGPMALRFSHELDSPSLTVDLAGSLRRQPDQHILQVSMRIMPNTRQLDQAHDRRRPTVDAWPSYQANYEGCHGNKDLSRTLQVHELGRDLAAAHACFSAFTFNSLRQGE